MQYISLPTKFKIHTQAKCCFTFSVYHVERKRLDLQFLVRHVEFRGQHFMLTITKNLNERKINPLLTSITGVRSQGKLLPPNWKDCQRQRIPAYWSETHEQNPVVPPQKPTTQ